ncbi:MAG: hypothetical protein SF182_25005 [Deltaproteobacteria bacterium]|nr:hypothetical protein [Deltaproteobacteria bacterium]
MAARVPRVAATVLRQRDQCHAQSGAPLVDCNHVEAGAVAAALAGLTRRCADAGAMRDAFPDGDPASALAAVLAAELSANGRALLGPPTLAASDPRVRRCRHAIGRARSMIIRDTLRAAAACQRRRDRAGAPADALSSACLSGARNAAIAAALVARGCTGIDGAAVGSCAPLPSCVVDRATASGNAIAATLFGAAPGASIDHDFGADLADAAHFYDLPYPSDLRLRADGSPDLAGYPIAPGNALTSSLKSIAGRRAGFPAVPVGYFRLSAAPAPRVPDDVIPARPDAPILLLNIDEAPSPRRGSLYPLVAHTPPTDPYVPAHLLAVGVMPGTVLPASSRYALVVMRAAGDARGLPLGVGLDLLQLRAGGVPPGQRGEAARALYAPLWPALRELGIDLDQVAAATVFTVGDTVADFAAMSTQLVARHPTTVEGVALDEVHPRFCELRGFMHVPQFQRGTPPFDTLGDFEIDPQDGLPKVQRDDVTPVVVTLPRQPMPVGGYPLMVYFHGSAGLAAQVVDRGRTLVAGPNGATNPVPGEGPAYVVAPYGIAAAASGLPTNPERLAGAALRAYLNLSNLAAYRFTFQQGTIEQRMLIDALGRLTIDPAVIDGCDGPSLPDGETAFRLRTAQLGIMGQSMGGQYVNMVGAVEPRVAGAVPTGSGGLFSKVVLDAEEVEGIAPVPIDVRPLIPALIGAATPLTFLHPAFGLLETAWEGAETAVFAPRLALDPLPGAARSIYQPVAIDDPGFPNSIYALMALASGTYQAGDVRFPGLQTVLATAGRDGLVPYPVADNGRDTHGLPYTGVVAQYASDGILHGHHIFTQLDAVQHQYACFFDSLLNGGRAVVPAPMALDVPCPR